MSNNNGTSECPKNSFQYNKTMCSCSPGYLFNASTKSCSYFNVPQSEMWTTSSVKQSNVDEDYKKAVIYQTYYVEISIAALLMWLLLCSIVRFGRLRDGRNAWFQIRWWISRFDFTFSTKHCLADQNVVKKRKTELGGAFTVASWMLFFGLLAALLHQIITVLGEDVYSVRPTNAPDFIYFNNEIELNLTTISSMTCSQLRGPSNIVIGSPGSIDYTVVPLSNHAKVSCQNSSIGPVLTLRCNNCPLTDEYVYISWQFFDVQNKVPATAVGFQFNFTTKGRVREKEYTNFISGTIKDGMKLANRSITYRGADTNVLKFNLFPRVHYNIHGLQLLQPSFYHFRPGSFARDEDRLQALLQDPKHGLVNTTLALHFMSEYMIEIDNKRSIGPVSFLADVGGLYCLSITMFLLLLTLCEMRIKRLRNEDQVMQNIRKKRIAEDHWNKLRRYVAYTYSCQLLDESYVMNEEPTCCIIGGNGLPVKKVIKREIDIQSFGFNRQPSGQYPSSAKDLHGSSRSTKEAQTFPRRVASDVLKDKNMAPTPSLPGNKGDSQTK